MPTSTGSAARDELDEIGLEEALADGALLVEWPELLAAGLVGRAGSTSRSRSPATGAAPRSSGAGTWPARLARTRRDPRLPRRRRLARRGAHAARRRRLVPRLRARSLSPLRGERRRGGAARPHPSRPSPRGRAAIRERPGASKARRSTPAAPTTRSRIAPWTCAPSSPSTSRCGDAGIRAPEIHAADIEAGLLLLEDLGGEGIARSRRRADPGALRSGDRSARLHARPRLAGRSCRCPTAASIASRPTTAMRCSSRCRCFPTGSAAMAASRPFPPATARRISRRLVGSPRRSIEDRATTWVLRDFHSPNILWQADASGIARVGIIDFQDALIGHPAYDVASLAQDARVPLAAGAGSAAEGALRRRPRRRRIRPSTRTASSAPTRFSPLQRATKVLGVFTRLALAEGKPGYQQPPRAPEGADPPHPRPSGSVSAAALV